MGSPTVFSGKRTKLLTSKGLLLSNGTVIDNDGIFNYFTNPGAEINATGMSAYADAAGSSPVYGTGGSPNVTWTRTTSSPLAGDASFLFTKDAANRQGQGVSIDFTVRDCDKGKVRKFSADYAIASGTFADDDMSIWFYDVTNSALLQGAPYLIKNHSLTSDEMFSEIQIPYNCSTLRLIIHVGSASALGYTVKFDNMFFGNSQKSYGAVATGVKSWTPTGSWSTNTTYTGKWYQVADIGYYEVKVALSGAPTAATLTVNLPPGHTIDTSKKADGDIRSPIGIAEIQDFGVASYAARVQIYNTTSVVLALLSRPTTYVEDATFVSNTLPMSFGNQDYITLTFSAPIVGWSSSQILSSEADTSPYYATALGSGSASYSTSAPLQFNTIVSDKFGSVTTGSGWRFYAKTQGAYEVGCVASASVATNSLIIYKNGVSTGFQLFSFSAAGYSFHGSAIIELNANDYVDIRPDGTLTISPAHVHINKILGPSQIAASETVAARYKTAAGQNISSSSTTIVDFGTKDFDYTSSTVTGGSWKFTAPISGLYEVSGHLMFTTGGGWASGEAANAALYKSGVEYARLSVYTSDTTHSNYVPLTLAATSIRLLAGEYVDVRVFQDSGASLALINNALFNWISIKRVGNY